MKRIGIGLALIFFLAGGLGAQLQKQRLFKVDPVSGLFKEIRVAVEYRIKGPFWAYVAPFGYHQTWIPRSNDRLGRPDNTQKYYGLGSRLGLRYYLSEDSPKGLFLLPMAAYRFNRVNQFDEGLSIVAREHFHSLGIGFAVGWQNLFGPKENFAYGILGGMEYYRQFGSDYDVEKYVQNWYEFPFSWKPDFFNGFRLYLGVELGFAFRQKHLHW